VATMRPAQRVSRMCSRAAEPVWREDDDPQADRCPRYVGEDSPLLNDPTPNKDGSPSALSATEAAEPLPCLPAGIDLQNYHIVDVSTQNCTRHPRAECPARTVHALANARTNRIPMAGQSDRRADRGWPARLTAPDPGPMNQQPVTSAPLVIGPARRAALRNRSQ
jgi:hypothetical protein